MTIDHRKVVALATHETPFVKRVDDIDDYQVTTTVTRYTKSVWLTDKFKAAALDLNFAYNKSLTDSITGNNLVTFSRASSGTYVGADGLIKTTPVNLFRYSEDFSNAAWSLNNATISANVETSPSGTTSADKISETTANGSHQCFQGGAGTSGTTYTASYFVKAAGRTSCRISFQGEGSATFNLTTGSVITNGLVSASITPAGNGWFRCVATETKTNNNPNVYFGPALDDGTISYAGDTSKGVFIWGAQVEEGSAATDYIPTGATISGAPRFDHDFVTGESLGLLMEKATTNIVLKSEKLNEWIVGNGSSVIANQAVAPDGTNTADRVQHGGGGSSWIRQDVLTSGVTYTVSVYAKAVTPGTNDQFTFALGDLSSVFTATGEWQRFTFTGTASNAAIYLNNGDDSFSTDVYFWGAQVEEGGFATSYISTDSSAATRAADIVEITGTNFSSFYNTDSNQLGTMFVHAGTNNPNNFDMIEISSGQISTRDTIRHNVNDGVTALTSVGGGQVSQQYVSSGTAAIKAAGNSVLGFAVNGTSTVDNGNQVNNNGNMTMLAFGRRSSSNTEILNGHIKRFAYFSTNLGDNTLQAITS